MIGSPKAAVVGLLLVCGGPAACAPAPAQPPEAAPTEPPPSLPAEPAPVPSAPAEEPEAESSVAETPEPATPEPEPEPEAPSKPSKPPTQVLTEADTDFLLDYPASSLKEAAQAKCREQAADPAQQAACLQKARDDFTGDVLSFRAAGDTVTWTIYRRAANRLDEVYTAKVKLTDAAESSVSVTPAGAAKGQRPFLRGQRELTFDVPDDYTLIVTDPALGKLVYRAKYGLVTR